MAVFILIGSIDTYAEKSINHYDELFNEANEQFKNGKFQHAINTYKKIENAGFQSAALFYNKGNAHFKLNDIPGAILYYERARMIAPTDKDIAFNLKLANQRITDKTDALPTLFYESWWMAMKNTKSIETLANIALILIWLALIQLVFYLLSKSPSRKRTAFIAGTIM